MGESIERTQFTESDRAEFKKRLRKETAVLKNLIDGREFSYSTTPNIGMEVEAWLVDKNHIPNPINKAFLKACDDPFLVEEISQFNFELNTDPLELKGDCLSSLSNQLSGSFEKSQSVAKQFESQAVFIGIHPMVRDEMLQPEYISHGERYEALNNEILQLRNQEPIRLDIKGEDHFKKTLDHILIEAACTSIQIHIQANQENFKRVYNASLISSIPSVALAANSPFLYGHNLWAETRIPLFEQSIALKQFRDKKGHSIGRVTFGTGYVQKSVLELFLENLDGYTPLAPVLFDDPPEKLHHLRFHNGTLWRWNRPIVGLQEDGGFNLRVEQRAMAAGPTVNDMVANAAFSIGLTQYFANTDKVPEESMTFTDCRNNFYKAAQYGLGAEVRWFGKTQALDRLILEDLIPKAKEGLQRWSIDNKDLVYYLDEVLHPRILNGQTGAKWQRAFISTHGRDFQALAEAYVSNQNNGNPVHQWQV